jgi:hypothetical protein
MPKGEVGADGLSGHGIFVDAGPQKAAQLTGGACPVVGFSVFEEPGTRPSPAMTGALWPCVWLNSHVAGADERIGDLAALLGRKRRERFIAAVSDMADPLCMVDCDWQFLLYNQASRYRYARLNIKFGPPVDVTVPVLFELPRQLQALAAIYNYGQLVFSTAPAGSMEAGRFVFVALPPTEELQTVLTNEIARLAGPATER